MAGAELMENATQFSPPTERVKVTSGFDVDGYQLTITDRGVGMTNEKVAKWAYEMADAMIAAREEKA